MSMDIARTLARKSLAFRGDDDDKNENFNKIMKLLFRHCSIMKKKIYGWMTNLYETIPSDIFWF